MLRFVGSVDGPRLAELGTSCPDHFLRTKIKPLFADWNPETRDVDALKATLEAGLSQYRRDYEAYYERCKRPGSPPMRDPNPTVVLIPGLGMIAWGKNKSESRVTAEFYNCAIEVMRGAEAIDRYEAMDPQEAFDIEYWSLEEAKLRRLPPEKELDRRIVAVVGAGSGIGKTTAHRLVKEGAHVVCVDRGLAAAEGTAREIVARYGEGIGVAGTGISSCGPAIGLACDITDRESVVRMLREALLAYGGLDSLVVTAGIFVPPDSEGRIEDRHWSLTFSVNVTGAYVVADEANKIFQRQGLPATVVLTTSANAVVAKKGSLAYDTSKAAANHLVRELAVEMAPLVRVNAVAPATVVKGSTMFPRDRVIASLTKYEIPFAGSETTEALRDKLAAFYAERSLTRSPIEPEDQAEAILLLVSRAPRQDDRSRDPGRRGPSGRVSEIGTGEATHRNRPARDGGIIALHAVRPPPPRRTDRHDHAAHLRERHDHDVRRQPLDQGRERRRLDHPGRRRQGHARPAGHHPRRAGRNSERSSQALERAPVPQDHLRAAARPAGGAARAPASARGLQHRPQDAPDEPDSERERDLRPRGLRRVLPARKRGPGREHRVRLRQGRRHRAAGEPRDRARRRGPVPRLHGVRDPRLLRAAGDPGAPDGDAASARPRAAGPHRPKAAAGPADLRSRAGQQSSSARHGGRCASSSTARTTSSSSRARRARSRSASPGTTS